MTDDEAHAIISKCPEGWTVVAVAAPTRAFRALANADYSTCRVEQLDSSKAKQGIFSWRVVATHAREIGEHEMSALLEAVKDIGRKQVKLKEMIKLNERERKAAMVHAQDPLQQGFMG